MAGRWMAAKWEKSLKGVPGWLTIEEARLLHHLAARQHPAGVCVEVGAYQGRSAIAMASALPEGHRLLSVDTFAGSPEHQPGESHFDPATLDIAGSVDTLAAFLHNTGRAGLSTRVEPWRMTSTEAAARVAGKVALLFLDADHSYAAVSADIAAWRRHLHPGAIVVLHDVGDWEGPTRCAADLLAQGFTRVDQAGSALALRLTPA